MKIIDLAKTLVGEKEISGNKGFSNKKLEDEMRKDGWKEGEAWCCYFQEMLWEAAYPQFEKEFDKLFSANCVQTLANFRNRGYGISTIPQQGALCIMQNYKSGKPLTTGHALLVTQLISNTEWTGIEGNTNAAGSREGTLVGEKQRSLMYYPDGLRVAGFVLIREHLKITD